MDYKPSKDTSTLHFIDDNVYNMAKKRIRKIISITDDQIVSFSGGKDSLTVVKLLQEVYEELGITRKVKVAFFDEEIIPPEVVDFIKKIYDSGEYDFRWYCIPLESQKYVLGNTVKYIQWDNDREWVREKPDWAICMDKEGLSEYDMDLIFTKELKGRVAVFRGLRASESYHRLKGVLKSPNSPYMYTYSKDKRLLICRPIYDWQVWDVFLYFYKKGIEYCHSYDRQMWSNHELTVSTALVSGGKKNFPLLKQTYDPEYYERIIKVFPDMVLQDRYYGEYKSSREDMFDDYTHDEDGLKQFIEDTITDERMKEMALTQVDRALRSREKNIKKNKYDVFGGYTFRNLFLSISWGSYKRGLLMGNKYSKKDFLFEGYSVEEYMEYKNKFNRERNRKLHLKTR